MKVYKNFSLIELNTFKLNTIAREFIEINKINDLYELNNFKYSDKYYILGLGSNTLFVNDFFDGVVIHVNLKGIKKIEMQESVLIEVMAGENWNDFVWYTVENGFCGIENLVSIPGSIGGAVVQNIGAYGVEIKNVLVEIQYFDVFTNSLITMKPYECNFGYRDSIFKTDRFKNKAIITKITLELKKDFGVFYLDYPGVKDKLKELKFPKLTSKVVAQAISDIRKNKLPDHRFLGNAGSIFKNPIVTKEKLEEIREKHPDIVFFPSQNVNKFKLSAGWLIEKAGFKGLSVGDACVYEKHALIIVNKGNAKGKDILNLINIIKSEVFDYFGIALEEEVNIVL